ncbi:hypothetical protein Tco_1347989, partial [Tanacetum coccineum]
SIATSGSGMMLSSVKMELFFFGVTIYFFPCDPLPLLFLGGIKPVEWLVYILESLHLEEVVDDDFGEFGVRHDFMPSEF